MENKDRDNSPGDTRQQDADSGNDSTNEMLQQEKLIDPGNEHSHHTGHEFERETKAASKHDADAGGDGTGTMGSKPE